MPSVILSPGSAYFNETTLTSMPAGNVTVPLADYVTGATGDGMYEVNFIKNPNTVFGTGPTTPAICCTKSTGPFAGLPTDFTQIHRLYRFQVVGGNIVSSQDFRLAGGITIDNVTPGTFGIETAYDVDFTALSNGDFLQWDATTSKFINVPPPNVGSIRAPSDFKFHWQFVVAGAADLTADDGSTDLTADDGTTMLTTDSSSAPSMQWWVDDGFGAAPILYLPDGTSPTMPLIGSSSSPNTYSTGGTDAVYLTAYATLSGGAWTATIVLASFNPSPSALAPAYAAGVVTLIAKNDGSTYLGTLGSTSSGEMNGGAGTGLAS